MTLFPVFALFACFGIEPSGLVAVVFVVWRAETSARAKLPGPIIQLPLLQQSRAFLAPCCMNGFQWGIRHAEGRCRSQGVLTRGVRDPVTQITYSSRPVILDRTA